MVKKQKEGAMLTLLLGFTTIALGISADALKTKVSPVISSILEILVVFGLLFTIAAGSFEEQQVLSSVPLA